MLVEWLNWVRSMRTDELLLILGVLLLVDAPRYAYSALIMAFWDTVRGLLTGRFPGHQTEPYTYTPPVSVIIAGYNEADTIARTMESTWNRYPCKQMIVVDDGSTDGMTEAAMTFRSGSSGCHRHSARSTRRQVIRPESGSALCYGRSHRHGRCRFEVERQRHL